MRPRKKPVRNRGPGKCTLCDESKPLTEFYKNSSAASGYQWQCKACINAYSRALHLRKVYGMTVGDYERMLTAQGGGCAVCACAHSRRGKYSFHVDHNHETGAVRALLCGGCNSALGHMHEDADRIRKLADYIESFSL